MIVVDASAVLEVLLRTRKAKTVEQKIFAAGETLHAPYLLDVEVAQVLRRFALAGELTAQRGREALDDLRALAITQYPHELLLDRVWELRSNLTAYDAVYVALAEALDTPLLTCDPKIASAPGMTVAVDLVE